MKKIISITILSVLFFGLFSLPAFAAIGYLRTPSGSPVLSPVNFQITLDSFEELGCGVYDYWAMEIKSVLGEYSMTGALVSTSLILNENVDLPNGDYNRTKVQCCGDVSCSSSSGSTVLEYIGEGEIIFTVVSASALISLPDNFVSGMLAWVSDTFTDLAPLIAIFLGLPLAFWGISKVISLMRFSKVKKDD